MNPNDDSIDGSSLLERIRVLEKVVDKLINNQIEIVTTLRGAGLIKFRKPGSQYEPKPTPT